MPCMRSFGALCIALFAGTACVDAAAPAPQPARIFFISPTGTVQSLELEVGKSTKCSLDVRRAGGAPVAPQPFVVLATTGTGVTVDAACNITAFAPGTATLSATTTVDGRVVRDSLLIRSIGYATLANRHP